MRMRAIAIVAALLTLVALPASAAITSVHTSGATAKWDSSLDKIGAEDTLTDTANAQARYCLHSNAARVNCDGLAVTTVTNSNGSGTTVWANVAVGGSSKITFRAVRGAPFFNASSWVSAGT